MESSLLRPDGAKKNFVFQFFYNAVILVLPLIISPYLTRTLGSNSLGVYTYTYSIAYYFVIFAMLGINKHGQRIIAQRRNDLYKLRTTFWSLYCIHFVASILALAIYFIYVIFICGSNVNIAAIQALYVFSAAIDITWLFYGLEKFKIVAIRNAIIRVLEAVCILIFVKSPADTWKYTLIMCLSVCSGHLVMMPQVVSAIKPVRFTKQDMLEHVKPLFTLFAAVIAVTLYTVFDKTLLGILSTKDDVAFYEYSDKIVKIPRTFNSIIGTVLFPRACRYAAESDIGKLKKNFSYCIVVTCFIGFASCFGLAAVAQTFATIYYGESFAVCGNIIISMCPIILIIGLGDTVRQCYIYPLKKDAAMVKILTVNAIVNLILSSILIPIMGVYGAVVGTVCAETVGLVAELWLSREYLSVKDFTNNILPLAVIGIIMYGCVRLVASFIDGSALALLLQILVGAIVFLVLFLVYAVFFNSMMKDMVSGAVRTVKNKIKK